MKIVNAILILLLGPALGVFLAFILGALMMPADPNFAANGGHAAPGDGLLVIPFLLISLVISVPLSVAAALRTLFVKPKVPKSTPWVSPALNSETGFYSRLPPSSANSRHFQWQSTSTNPISRSHAS